MIAGHNAVLMSTCNIIYVLQPVAPEDFKTVVIIIIIIIIVIVIILYIMSCYNDGTRAH